jgi:MFS family permease
MAKSGSGVNVSRDADGPLFSVLGDRTYRHLFLAQVVALAGTGLTTVALGLLAYDLAGKDASAVLGTALAIKMVAYVLIAPIAGAYASRVSRRALLVALDLARLPIAAAPVGLARSMRSSSSSSAWRSRTDRGAIREFRAHWRT